MVDSVVFDRATALAFLEAYHYAVDSRRESFEFSGREVLVDYAKYVVEYLVLCGLLTEQDVNRG